LLQNTASPAPIQITIGRIEVQAVVPPAPSAPPPPRRTPTGLTLAAYLATRNSQGQA
jgi:hypothetical protein